VGRAAFIHILILFSLFPNWRTLYAENCPGAVDLYNQAAEAVSPAQKARLLKAAIPLCGDPEILSRVYNNLADAYDQDNRLSLALRYYRNALEIKPDLSTACYSAADIFFRLKDYQSAGVLYARGLRYSSSTEEADCLAACRELGKTHVMIYFERDSHKIAEVYQDRLNALGQTASQGQRMIFVGHTCSLGSDKYNLILSLRRAKEAAQYLTEHFPIDPKQIEMFGSGEETPLVDNDTSEGRALNRRVEMRLENEAPLPMGWMSR